MIRVRASLATLMLLAGCAMGPTYHPPEGIPQAARIGSDGTGTPTRAFFDSLVAARAADSMAPLAPASKVQTLTPDSMADVAWIQILRDTTLLRLVHTAVQQNRDVQVAIGRIREFRGLVGVSRGPLLPSLTANASASTNQVAIGAFPPTSYNALRATADVAWELDFWGRIRRGIEASRADVGAQEANERSVLLSLVSNVASGYLQLLELDQEHGIAERTLASRQQTLALARSRFNQGVISELDVRQFEAEVAVPATTLAQTDRLRAQQEHALSQLLGQAPGQIPRGGSLTEAVSLLLVPDSLPAALLARRPDLQLAERQYAAATARIGVAAASRLPTIAITGSYGTQSSNTGNLFTSQAEVYQLLGGISIPLFTGGRLSGQLEAARGRADQARATYEQAVLTALHDASDALASVRSARDQTAAQQTQVQALRRALGLAELRYRTGVASYLEVLDAQRGLFTAELSLSQSELLELTSAVQLYRALGGSWRQ
ncbi:MAG: efflux transporter outer membrane subunit [Gemmatimonadota bacterium]